MWWSPRCNSYVLAELRADATSYDKHTAHTVDGKRVILASVNGIGEVRWTVDSDRIAYFLRDENKEHFSQTDGHEQLAAARYFGLAPRRET